MKRKLLDIYDKLYQYFGPQGWWPGESDFEVVVGAILTQNTSWTGVERAIARLKKARCLTVARMNRVSEKKLGQLIRPAGTYRLKARRLKFFLRFLKKNYQGSLARMKKKDAVILRRELLAVNGIGPETADSILLYACEKPIFVIDAYTRRIMARHQVIKEHVSYQGAQDIFMRHLKKDVSFFNEYHALLVRCAKEFCKKTKERCGVCPVGPGPRVKGQS